MLRIAVCDDEPQIVKQLADMVMQCVPDCELSCYEDGESVRIKNGCGSSEMTCAWKNGGAASRKKDIF